MGPEKNAHRIGSHAQIVVPLLSLMNEGEAAERIFRDCDHLNISEGHP